MKLYQRDDSTEWWMDFRVNGKRIRRSTERPLKDRKGAERVMAEAYSKAMNQHQFGEKEEISLADAWDLAIHRVRKNDSTRRSYDTLKRQTLGLGAYARKDWFSLPSGILCSEITDKHIRELVKAREKHGHKDGSINVLLRVFKAVILGTPKDYAVNRELTFEMKEHFEKQRFLTREEEQLVLNYLVERSHQPAYAKARDLMIFLLDTGTRLGEALNLRWSKVNLTERTIEMYNIKTKVTSLVPISNRVHAMLERKRNQEKPFEQMDRAVKLLRAVVHKLCDTDPVQVSQEGSATIHSLRDTYASRLVQKNMSLHKVSKLLGHASPTMTRKYAHLATQDVADEARKLINE